MKKVLIVYCSTTGNTEKMAQLIKEGAESAGAEVTVEHVSEASPEELEEYDCVVLGCPSVGGEELDEEMEDFVESIEDKISGKRIGLFGFCDWGDGQWMRNWYRRMDNCGAKMVGKGLISREEQEDEEAEDCLSYGERLAS